MFLAGKSYVNFGFSIAMFIVGGFLQENIFFCVFSFWWLLGAFLGGRNGYDLQPILGETDRDDNFRATNQITNTTILRWNHDMT